jgi:hypothetical protein
VVETVEEVGQFQWMHRVVVPDTARPMRSRASVEGAQRSAIQPLGRRHGRCEGVQKMHPEPLQQVVCREMVAEPGRPAPPAHAGVAPHGDGNVTC